ncbi:hypothetical protein KAR91_52555 [Candidatus Pacearchaeota archaeon]|nr:hypothetical protein [Candidatus Pacearchaeota archaeon]
MTTHIWKDIDGFAEATTEDELTASPVEQLVRTPADWEQETKINVIDPDGWRFAHGGMQPKSYREAINKEEFMARVAWSTVMGL